MEGRFAAWGAKIEAMIEVEKLVEALNAYRNQMLQRGYPLKAAVVEHCITIVRRVASQD